MPWRREWPPTPVFWPGESHVHRSLVGYRPWGHKELDTTELLTLHFNNPSISETQHIACIFITHSKCYSDLFSAVFFQMVIQKFKQFLSCGFYHLNTSPPGSQRQRERELVR